MDGDIETLVRGRLRATRQALGWSLNEVAARSGLNTSTISRIETGRRGLTLEAIVALAGALQIEVGTLLDTAGSDDDDIVIRPVPLRREGSTMWRLSQASSRTIVTKLRLEPSASPRAPKVHPGSDWFYVLSGKVRLQLGGRELVIVAGEAAEFSTMTPHAFDALDGPAELIMVFDADSRRAHVHTDDPD